MSRSHYDAAGAAKYDLMRSMRPRAPQRMIELANLTDGQYILDLACGTGQLSVALKAHCHCEFVGVDRSIDMLRRATTKRIYKLLVKGNVIALPFEDQAFDAVIGSHFMHHIPTDLRPLVGKECFRVLRQGTAILMTTAHEDIYKHPLSRFFPEFASIDLGRFPHIEMVCNWLFEAGFTEIIVDRIHEEPLVLNDVFADWVECKPISTLELIEETQFRKGMRDLREQVIATRSRPEIFHWTSTLVCGKKRQ